LSFNDAFGSVSSRSGTAAGDHGIVFEDTFGGSKPLSFNDAFGDVVQPAAASQAISPAQVSSPPKQTSPNQSEIRAAAPPAASPPRSPGGPVPASPSTVRSVSPTHRVASPKPRVSTGSSNEGASAPAKTGSTSGRSRMSLRFPFGKKDKKKSKHDQSIILPDNPPQSTFLSPVQEPSGFVTPAVDDDVEPVKQLCGMGFSRTQAVEALEKYGYDVPRALNSLLGAAPAA